MTAISGLKAKMVQESHSFRLLQGPRNAASCFAKLLLLAATVLLCPHTLLAQHAPPTSEEVKAFAERAASEQYIGKEVRVPDRIFTELVKGVAAGAPYCRSVDRNMMQAYQIIPTPNLPSGLAIKGGGCFCSPTGNCAFWIYQLKNGKCRAVLSRGSVQSFGFLKSRSHGYPDLVTWSHGSAMMSGANLYRFDGIRYVVSGGWDVEFVLGDDGQVDLDKTRITSHFTSKDQLPKEVEP